MPGYAVQTAGEVFAEFRRAAGEMEDWAARLAGAGLDHGRLEKEIVARGREAERLLLQAHLDLRAAREERLARVTAADGSVRPRAEKDHSRLLATAVGMVTVTRIGYRAPRSCTRSISS